MCHSDCLGLFGVGWRMTCKEKKKYVFLLGKQRQHTVLFLKKVFDMLMCRYVTISPCPTPETPLLTWLDQVIVIAMDKMFCCFLLSLLGSVCRSKVGGFVSLFCLC